VISIYRGHSTLVNIRGGRLMTRKKFIKTAMAEGCSRNVAQFAAVYSRGRFGSYEIAYEQLISMKGRFEDYI
jgi:hypothetical protein